MGGVWGSPLLAMLKAPFSTTQPPHLLERLHRGWSLPAGEGGTHPVPSPGSPARIGHRAGAARDGWSRDSRTGSRGRRAAPAPRCRADLAGPAMVLSLFGGDSGNNKASTTAAPIPPAPSSRRRHLGAAAAPLAPSPLLSSSLILCPLAEFSHLLFT